MVDILGGIMGGIAGLTGGGGLGGFQEIVDKAGQQAQQSAQFQLAMLDIQTQKAMVDTAIKFLSDQVEGTKQSLQDMSSKSGRTVS
jgi:hypothetical protein